MAWEVGGQVRRSIYPTINEEVFSKEGYIEESEAKILLYKFLKENPTFATQLLMGVKLFPFQHMAIKAMMETDYFLGIWSRGLSKSFTTGIFAVLDAILHQGVNTGIISKTFRQCLNEESWVNTNRGLIPIKDCKKGDLVFSRDQPNKILNKWSNPHSQGLSLETSKGFKVQGKNDHKLLCLNTKTQETEYKTLQDIVPDDAVAIQTNADLFPSKCNLSTEDAYFYGQVVGDGCISKDKYGYVIVTTEDLETIQFLQEYGQSKGLNVLVTAKSESCNNVRINNKKFVQDFFSDYTEVRAHQKYIPSSILKSTKENTKAFLQGLFDADGTVANDRVELATSSLRLAEEVQLTLLRFGIVAKIQHEKERGEFITTQGIKTFGREAYKVRVTGTSFIRKFQKEIGFRLTRKQAKFPILTNDKGNCDLVYGSGAYLSSKYSFPETLAKNLGKKRLKHILEKYSDRISPQDISKLKGLIPFYWDRVTIKEKLKKIKTIDIEVENDPCYTGQGFVNHNSKMIFQKILDIASEPGAEFLQQAITNVSKSNDGWTMEIGRSRIIALPLGDGEKLRGFRFHRMIIDELLLMPEKILNEVILPFLAVVENPTERQDVFDIETKLIEQGTMVEEDRTVWPHNKIIGLSSASYQFEHLFTMYSQYCNLIESPAKDDHAHRAIMHLAYDVAPDQLYDKNLITQSKATMSLAQFEREFGAKFTADSAGFFKVSTMRGCTYEDGLGHPTIEVKGDPNAEYLISFDPSWSESESSDDFSMQVIKLLPDKKKGLIVHGYARSGGNLKSHMAYFLYLLTHFNVVGVVGDYNGGVQFINSCNESKMFTSKNINLGIIDADLDKPQEYIDGVRDLKKQYNKASRSFVFLRKPTSQWIRFGNELLQAAFDHKRMLFAAAAMDDDFKFQTKQEIPIDKIEFLSEVSIIDKNIGKGAKMIDLVEFQRDIMDIIKTQCALIEVTSSPTGNQTFDLPLNLRKQTGPNKTRKDSYSTIVLGNWMMHVFYDLMDTGEIGPMETFAPILI